MYVRPKIYYKSQLAELYYPEKEHDKAVNAFYRRIIRNEELIKELSETGWKIRYRSLTPRQVNIFIKHLGTPPRPSQEEETHT